MAEQPDYDQLVDQFNSLPETEKLKAYRLMTPEQRTGMLAAVERRKKPPPAIGATPAQAPPPYAGPSPYATAVSAQPSPYTWAGIKARGLQLLERGLEKTPLGGIPGQITGRALEEKGLEAIPYIGGGVGGAVGAATTAPFLGGVPGFLGGAAIGGAGGEAMRQWARRRLGFTQPEYDPGKMATAGAEQMAYEALGRGTGAALGIGARAVRGALPVEGTTIRGTFLPETVGQKYGGALSQTAENYIRGTFLGGALKNVRAAQEAGMRQIVNDLAGVNPVDADAMAVNWRAAANKFRADSGPFYDAIRNEPITDTSIVDAALQRYGIPDTERIIRRMKGSGLDPNLKVLADQLAQANQYPDWASADPVWKQNMINASLNPGRQVPYFTAAQVAQLQAGGSITVDDAIAARHEIGRIKAAIDSQGPKGDLAKARDLRKVYESLNDMIDANLTTQAARDAKATGDLLTRRSHIAMNIENELRKIEQTQVKPYSINKGDIFTKMVYNLSRQGDLDTLFTNPADKQAMLELRDFLKEKYPILGTKAGIGEGLARVGIALRAFYLPVQLVVGSTTSALHGGAELTGLWALSNVLARPGGARLALRYLRSPVNAAGPLAIRIARWSMSNTPSEETGYDQPESPESKRQQLIDKGRNLTATPAQQKQDQNPPGRTSLLNRGATMSGNGDDFFHDISQREGGFADTAWLDTMAKSPTHPEGVWTIGYGRTEGVTPGQTTTQDAEEMYTRAKTDQLAEQIAGGNKPLVTVAINRDQLRSLVSFAYNEGIEALKNSTLLKKLNASDFQGVRDEFAKWNIAGGQRRQGLANRRMAEAAPFIPEQEPEGEEVEQ
jgi:lysozyme